MGVAAGRLRKAPAILRLDPMARIIHGIQRRLYPGGRQA